MHCTFADLGSNKVSSSSSSSSSMVKMNINMSSPSSEDSESTWLDGATAVVRNDRDLAR